MASIQLKELNRLVHYHLLRSGKEDREFWQGLAKEKFAGYDTAILNEFPKIVGTPGEIESLAILLDWSVEPPDLPEMLDYIAFYLRFWGDSQSAGSAESTASGSAIRSTQS